MFFNGFIVKTSKTALQYGLGHITSKGNRNTVDVMTILCVLIHYKLGQAI